MIKYKTGEKPKINDKVSWISFGKSVTGVVMKILEKDQKELKVLPDRNIFNKVLVAIKAKNVTLIK